MKSILAVALFCLPLSLSAGKQEEKSLLLFLQEVTEIAEPEDAELIEKIRAAASQQELSFEALDAASLLLEKRADKISSPEKASALLASLLAWLSELLGLELNTALESLQALTQDDYEQEDQ